MLLYCQACMTAHVIEDRKIETLLYAIQAERAQLASAKPSFPELFIHPYLCIESYFEDETLQEEVTRLLNARNRYRE